MFRRSAGTFFGRRKRHPCLRKHLSEGKSSGSGLVWRKSQGKRTFCQNASRAVAVYVLRSSGCEGFDTRDFPDDFNCAGNYGGHCGVVQRSLVSWICCRRSAPGGRVESLTYLESGEQAGSSPAFGMICRKSANSAALPRSPYSLPKHLNGFL